MGAIRIESILVVQEFSLLVRMINFYTTGRPLLRSSWLGWVLTPILILCFTVQCHLSSVLRKKRCSLGSEGAPCMGPGVHGEIVPGRECLREAHRLWNWVT